MARARTNVAEMAQGLMNALDVIKPLVDLTDPAQSDAWAEIETYCAVSLRVMAKTNPSKIRSEAMTVNIQCLIPPGSPKV